jgi:cytochrome c oxidase accessory protein FixG
MTELNLYASRPKPADAADGIPAHDVEAINTTATRKVNLYKAREAVYPKAVDGPYRKLKWLMMGIALAVYYALPWIRWDRGTEGASQAVLADFEGRRFYFFWLEIWPQEVYYITGLLLLGALALFLASALFGRVWCGYACPQTVWTDLYMHVERFIEGDRNKQIRLSRQPWTLDKVGKKLAKHSIWLLIAFMTGGAFIMYFVDAPTLVMTFFTGDASVPTYIFVALLTFTTYMLAGTMREQVCIYMCPWPRIQGAMLDEHSLQVTYRKDRGEPRGPQKKGASWDGRGDCIDCKACVAVCPMGIDIRDGMQLECINCGLCVDACNDIMAKIGRPKNLIAYDTDANIARRQHHDRPQVKLVRPRTILYVVLLAAISVAMVVSFGNRTTLELNVIKDRSPPFVPMSDGSVRNGYMLKVLNKANETRAFTITATGADGVTLTRVGGVSPEGVLSIEIEPDRLQTFRVFLTVPREGLTAANLPVTFEVAASDGRDSAATRSVFATGQGG